MQFPFFLLSPFSVYIYYDYYVVVVTYYLPPPPSPLSSHSFSTPIDFLFTICTTNKIKHTSRDHLHFQLRVLLIDFFFGSVVKKDEYASGMINS